MPRRWHKGLAAAAQLRLLRGIVGAALAFLVLSAGLGAPFSREDFQGLDRVQDVMQGHHWLIAHDEYPENRKVAIRDAFGWVSRKPPVFDWLSVLAFRIMAPAPDSVKARAVSLLAATALAVEVLCWSAANLGPAAGWLSFAFLLGTYAFTSRVALVRPDVLFTFFLVTAYLLLYGQLEGRSSPWRAIGAGVFLGLATLTKTPAALVLAGLALLVYGYLLAGRRGLAILKRTRPGLLILVWGALTASWYAPALAMLGRPFLDLLLRENLGHFLSAGLGGSGESARPAYYFVARVVGGMFPFTFLLPSLGVAVCRRGAAANMPRAVLYQLAFALATVGLFSLASAKRDNYILPVLPAAAILVASLFTTDLGKDGAASLWLRDAGVGLVAAGALGLILVAWTGGVQATAHLRLHPSDALQVGLFERAVSGRSGSFLFFSIACAGAALAIFGFLARGSGLGAGSGLAVISLAGVVLWTGAIRPELWRMRSYQRFARQIAAVVDSAPLYSAISDPSELAYYLGRHVPLWREAPRRAADIRAFLIARRRDIPSLKMGGARLMPVLEADVVDSAGALILYRLEGADLARFRGQP